MATAYGRVTLLMGRQLRRAKDATSGKEGLTGDASERLLVREDPAGLKRSVKELARVVDRHKAEQDKKERTQSAQGSKPRAVIAGRA